MFLYKRINININTNTISKSTFIVLNSNFRYRVYSSLEHLCDDKSLDCNGMSEFDLSDAELLMEFKDVKEIAEQFPEEFI